MDFFPPIGSTTNVKNKCSIQYVVLSIRALLQQYAATRAVRNISSTLGSIFLALLVAGTAVAQSCPPYPSPHQRIGFNVAPDKGYDINDYDAALLGAGWYHNYGSRNTPYHPGGIQFHQMVRADTDRTQLDSFLASKVRNNPGALWILGNEPDRYGQDGLTPAEYAEFYHDIYTYLRAADPTSRIAIAGIVQPTPIRLRYLDMVLSSYQQRYGTPMPVEIWDIHNFILPENCAWGASIPPGLESYRDEGVPCPATLDDHGDFNIFKAQLRTFRQWMNDRGFRNTPLIVSEYGILLSKYHGYDYARVRNFMVNTFDYMLNTTDAQLGYPADGNRLVQEFAWFSLNYWEFDINTYFGLNGNLFDHDSAQMMPLGHDFAAYTKAKTLRTIDLSITDFRASATTVNTQVPVTLDTTFVNQGGIAAENVTLELWDGNPMGGGTLIGTSATLPQVLAGCYAPTRVQQQWIPTSGGIHTIYGVLSAGNQQFELDEDNNIVAVAVNVNGPAPTVTTTNTPIMVTPTATATLIPTTVSSTTATPTPTGTLPPTAISTPTSTPTPMTVASVVVDPATTTKLTLNTANGAIIRIVIPAGTVNEPITLMLRQVQEVPTTGQTLGYAGHAFRLEAYRNGEPMESFQLSTPILLTVGYLDGELGAADEQSLVLYSYDSATNNWLRNGITLISHDTQSNLMTVSYSDEQRTASASRLFAILAEGTSSATATATATATPTATATLSTTPTPTTPTPTSTPLSPTNVEKFYLPLITNN